MTILVRQNIYSAFLDGEVTAMEALRSLCDDYDEIESSYKDFEKLRDQTREQISNVVSHMDGEQVEVKGFGFLRIMPPSVVRAYDKESLRQLMDELHNEGHGDIAERIRACLVARERVGTLRIERERGMPT